MKFFDNYVSNYDMSDPDIFYKYYHSHRVMDICELLATKLNLSKKDIYLAKVIGILHDIGRFEQDKLYDSFKDDKINHGEYGVVILKETNALSYFDIEEEDYEVVYKAIKNHNKYKIEPGLNEREELFTKLIRDADKLDILYVLGEEKIINTLKQDESNISKILETSFFNNIPGNITDVQSKNDALVIHFSYIYDINFEESFEIIRKQKYYDKIYERINRKDIFKSYLEHTNKYIKERID